MKDEDRSRIIEDPVPSGEKLLNKVDNRDKALRVFEVAVLTCVVVFNVLIGLRIQQVIDTNNQATITARNANVERQNDLKNYVKCVILIRFNTPPIDQTNQEAVPRLLDECATKDMR